MPTYIVAIDWSLSDTYSSPKACYSLLVLRNLDSIYYTGGYFKHRNHQWNAKNMALLSRPPKGHIFIVWELRQHSPCSTSAGNVNAGHPELFTTLCKSANISENTLSIDCGSSIHLREQVNLQTWNAWMISPDYALSFSYPAILSPLKPLLPLTWMKPPGHSFHLNLRLSTLHFPFSGPGFTGSAVKFSFVYLLSSFSLSNTLTSCYVIMCQLQQNHLTSPLLIHVPNFWMGWWCLPSLIYRNFFCLRIM